MIFSQNSLSISFTKVENIKNENKFEMKIIRKKFSDDFLLLDIITSRTKIDESTNANSRKNSSFTKNSSINDL